MCHTNLNPPEGETFTTKDGDLQGFWDMMMLQVDDVDAAFANIQKCKENGWTVSIYRTSRFPLVNCVEIRWDFWGTFL